LFLLHDAISSFAELHNNNLLYLLRHSNLRVKKCTPCLFSQKVFLVNSLQCGKACQECSEQQEKNHSHTNSAVSRQVYVHALLVQYRYTVFIQHTVRCGPTSETAWMRRRQNNLYIYIDFTELKKIASGIHSNFSNYSSLFSSRSNFVAIRSLSSKNNLQLTVLVYCLFTFYFIVHYSKEK